MTGRRRKVLKWIGIVAGALVIIAVALGIWVSSVIPPAQGTPITLNAELFKAPAAPLPLDDRILYKSASEIAGMIRNKEAKSEEVVRALIDRIKNENHNYNALIWLREEEAIADAKRCDERIAAGDSLLPPLFGVPITIKEHYWVKGSPSTMNAKMFGFIAPEDGPAVKALKDAGAIILGTTNVPFMLSDYQTQGEVYPTASNPYDTTRTPGGSTGGGAAALAAGFTCAELGSDLGGSIRVPSAFCGLWGLKSTCGAINMTQGASPDTVTKFTRFALASSGPLARVPEDLALMWHALRNTPLDPKFQKPIDRPAATTRTIDQYRFAWMDEWPHGSEHVAVSVDVKKKLALLVDSLQKRGVQVTKDAPDIYEDLQRMFLTSFGGMMGEGQPWLLRKLMLMQMGGMAPTEELRGTFAEVLDDPSDVRWAETEKERAELQGEWDSFFKKHDFIILPLSYGAAFKKCPQGSDLAGDNGAVVHYMDYVPYAYVINATGNPTLSVPMGLNDEGLPIGLQIVGPQNSEEELLHLAMLLKPLVPGFVRPKSR